MINSSTEKDALLNSEDTASAGSTTKKIYRYLFSEEYHQSRRMIAYQFSALCYSIYTTVLYFNSINEFPQHAQGPHGYHLLPARITNLAKQDPAMAIPSLLILSSCCLTLLYSNQKTFPKRLQKLFDYENEIPQSKAEKRLIDASISAVFKAVTTSSSLYALTSNVFTKWFGTQAGFAFATTFTCICLPGNFFAQFSVFLEHFIDNLNMCSNKPVIRKVLSHYFAMGYAISNAALYFNAFDAAPSHIGWIKNRLTDAETPAEYVALTFGIIMSLVFVAATWKRFEERIYRLMTSDKQYVYSDSPIFPSTVCQANPAVLYDYMDIKFKDKCNFSANTISATWKTLVTTGSIIGFLAKNLGAMNNKTAMGVTFGVLTITTLASFFPQLSLYARSNDTIVEQERQERSGKSPGFFNRLKSCNPAACCSRSRSLTMA